MAYFGGAKVALGGFSETQLGMVHARLLHSRTSLYTVEPIQSNMGDGAHLEPHPLWMLMAPTWVSLRGYWVGAFLRLRDP
jgi:hypothetical protein